MQPRTSRQQGPATALRTLRQLRDHLIGCGRAVEGSISEEFIVRVIREHEEQLRAWATAFFHDNVGYRLPDQPSKSCVHFMFRVLLARELERCRAVHEPETACAVARHIRFGPQTHHLSIHQQFGNPSQY